jgi:hypothetical protein
VPFAIGGETTALRVKLVPKGIDADVALKAVVVAVADEVTVTVIALEVLEVYVLDPL